MLILDGKKTAAEIRTALHDEIERKVKNGTRPPGLAVILVGENPASKIYVHNKEKACTETGIKSFPFVLNEKTSKDDLLKLINELNVRQDVDGILLQLPLPKGMEAEEYLLAIDPEKDVDGFHPLNMGRLALGLPGLRPCTPAGILKLLERYNLDLKGKKAVILGRSDIVGKPLALMLLQKGIDATVTICHSATKDLNAECKQADYIFLAMGKPGAITGDMLKADCIVVDVGINRTENGLCGDADFKSVSKKAAALTPVPGGVGPMTIAMLLNNTVASWKKRISESTYANII